MPTTVCSQCISICAVWVVDTFSHTLTHPGSLRYFQVSPREEDAPSHFQAGENADRTSTELWHLTNMMTMVMPPCMPCPATLVALTPASTLCPNPCVPPQSCVRPYPQGFYCVRPVEPQDVLVVGPYQGTLGCLRIPFSRGVCGAAARTQQTQLVPDVHSFPGHIACASRYGHRGPSYSQQRGRRTGMI